MEKYPSTNYDFDTTMYVVVVPFELTLEPYGNVLFPRESAVILL